MAVRVIRADDSNGTPQQWVTSISKPFDLPLDGICNAPPLQLFTLTRERMGGQEGRVVEKSLLLRCSQCDFGYDGVSPPTVPDFLRMGQEAVGHMGNCAHTKQTDEPTSPGEKG